MQTTHSVRLSASEIALLKDVVMRVDANASIYLFGSRTDIDQRGGDIDILVLSQKLNQADIRGIRLAFFENFGEQKLDIVLDRPDPTQSFTKIILKKAVLL